MRKVLSEEQKQYIKEHPTESAYAMAKRFGCSEQSVYYYLHKYHGDSFLEVKKAEQAYKHKVVREMYPTHTASEIASILGITKNAVNNMAQRLGVRHTDEFSEIIKHEYITKTQTEEAKAKRIETIRKLVKSERIRHTYGLPQKTKRKVSDIPKRYFCARNYLVRQYNYFYDKNLGLLLTIFYDDKTRRLPPEREQHYRETYHIDFRKADE